MNLPYKKFLLNLTIFTVGVSIVAFIIFYFLPIAFTTPAWPYLILFFFSVTLLVHYVLLKSTAKKFSRFTANFMLSTALKLLLYLAVIVIYALFNKDDAINFIITFFALYVLFTIFEVVSILNFSKAKPDVS